MNLPRPRWIVDIDGSQIVTSLRFPNLIMASPTWGTTRRWTYRGALRLARRWSRRYGKDYEVFGPLGKGDD